MLTFRTFIENEEEKNLSQMLRKLPATHRELVKGYDFKFHSGNTLDGDDQHVGYMDDEGKEIAVAAPWKYGRGFVVLHEIAHLVWAIKMTPELKNQWKQLLITSRKELLQYSKKTGQDESPLKQNAEELFSMAYANAYTDCPLVKYNHPKWMLFIKNKVPN